LVLCGLTMAIYFPVAMVYLISMFGKDVDMAIATTMAFAGICVMTIHWSLGQLSQTVGIRNALLLGPGFLFLSLVLLVLRKKVFTEELDL